MNNTAQAAEAANKYNVVNGTSYHNETPDAVIRVLETARQTRDRIRVTYGDRETGKSWLDIYYVTGTIGRSTGTNKIPLIIASNRSYGGPGLLEHCIIRIKDMRTGYILYKQSNYQDPEPTIKPNTDPETQAELPYIVEAYGQLFSRHKSYRSAQIMQSKLQ